MYMKTDDSMRTCQNMKVNFQYFLDFLVSNHGCQMAIARFLESYVFGPSGFLTMAPLCYAAKFDPFLSLDCAWVEGVGAQSSNTGF